MSIPFNKPFSSGKEFEYMKDAISRGKISGDGHYSKLVHSFLESRFGTRKALFVTSGTAALEMAALLANLHEGDEVILPSYTFVSTANAFILRNAKVVFADIEPDTLNVDPTSIDSKINDKTKVIVPVHYAGISCQMDEIVSLASKHELLIIEDAAQGVNAKYKDKYLGTIGHFGCYSFHETKNFQCGEGGAILLNDPGYIERAEFVREKGTNRNKFFRGEIDKYTWVDVGSSYIGSDLLAAYLWAQLEVLEDIQSRRKHLFNTYFEELQPLEEHGLLRLPRIPSYASPNYHMFYFLMPDEGSRNRMLEHLKASKIHAIFHYIPLHLSPMGRAMGCKQGDLPVTESLAGRIVRLPLFNELSKEEVHRIVLAVRNYYK